MAWAVGRWGGHGVDGEGEEEEDVEEQHDEVDVTPEPVPLVSGEKRLQEYAMNIRVNVDYIDEEQELVPEREHRPLLVQG